MGDRVTNGYRRLFEVRLLHHYWLDDGKTVFDLLSDQAQKDARLLAYDRLAFFAVAPTAATAKAFRGLGCVYKDTALGCVVATTNRVEIPSDTVWEFVVTVRDTAVWKYTALTLRPQTIYVLYSQADKQTYRYKEHVPVLSNVTGATRGADLEKTLFLSREFPPLTAGDQVESLVLSGTDVLQLTSDQPNAETQRLTGEAAKWPVFVHQGDVPALVPPAGLAGVPARGVQLTDDIPDNVFALIRLSAKRPDDDDFSFLDGSGHAKTTSPVFQVRFKNRSTVWQYRNKQTGALDSAEPAPLPLTYLGNAGTKQKPSEGLVKPEKSGDRITQLVSEIYV